MNPTPTTGSPGSLRANATEPFDYIDAETDAFALQQVRDHHTLLMGRNTYDAYAQAWPGRGGDVADRINAMTKLVVSTTLTAPKWANTTVLDGDLVQAVTTLRQEPDQDVLMHGYGPVAKTLMRHGLLDELYLWVHPVLAGIGTPDDMLISEGLNTPLALLDVRRLTSGVVILSYGAS
ncbi:MAG: dihydrofolate reductase family protein [Pseudonocardia sp.]